MADQEAESKGRDERGEKVADPEAGVSRAEEGLQQVLSNKMLFVLGTGVFALWAVTISGILQTSMILPILEVEFNASAAQVQWVAASNMLAWGCLQIVAGRCCDVYGRKRGLYVGMVIWIIANIVSTFMPNLAGLNVCRGFTGAAAALMLPASTGMIGVMFPVGRKRTLAFVAVTCGGVSGATLGEIVAGALMEYNRWTWRPCYLIIAVASIYPLVIIAWLVPLDPPFAESKKVDWIGSGLMCTSLFLLLFSFTLAQTERRGWQTPYLPALIVCSALVAVAFVLRQRQLMKVFGRLDYPPPLIPPSLLTKDCWNLLIIYIASFAAWVDIDVIMILIPYLYIDVLGLNKLEAGLRLSVTAFSGTIAAVIVALTINRIPPRILITIGCLISVTTPVLFAVREVDWPFWKADLWGLLLIAYGSDSIITAGLTIISMTAPVEDGSVATAIYQTSCRLGFAVGLSISTLIGTSLENKALARGAEPKDALLAGLRGGFWLCAGCLVVAALVVGFGMRGWDKLNKDVVKEDRVEGGSSPDESPALGNSTESVR